MVEIIEKNDYKTKVEALIRENELMNEYKSNLNSCKAYLTTNDKKIYKKQNAIKNNVNNICECGGKYTSYHRGSHFQSKKHKQHEQQIINNSTNNYNTTNNYNITNLTINK